MFVTMPAAIQYVRAGNLRALAVTTGTRSDALPDIPAVKELVPDYEATTWYGVGAPKKTPAEIVRTAQQGNQYGHCRSQIEGAVGRPGR
jgi:tripartite-type tricarboxylate transporter receptor subunit TctC